MDTLVDNSSNNSKKNLHILLDYGPEKWKLKKLWKILTLCVKEKAVVSKRMDILEENAEEKEAAGIS